MLTKNHARLLAYINAEVAAACEANSDPAQRVGAGTAIMKIIAAQVAVLGGESPGFDALWFIKACGVTEDWMQDRILNAARAVEDRRRQTP